MTSGWNQGRHTSSGHLGYRCGARGVEGALHWDLAVQTAWPERCILMGSSLSNPPGTEIVRFPTRVRVGLMAEQSFHTAHGVVEIPSRS